MLELRKVILIMASLAFVIETGYPAQAMEIPQLSIGGSSGDDTPDTVTIRASCSVIHLFFDLQTMNWDTEIHQASQDLILNRCPDTNVGPRYATDCSSHDNYEAVVASDVGDISVFMQILKLEQLDPGQTPYTEFNLNLKIDNLLPELPSANAYSTMQLPDWESHLNFARSRPMSPLGNQAKLERLNPFPDPNDTRVLSQAGCAPYLVE